MRARIRTRRNEKSFASAVCRDATKAPRRIETSIAITSTEYETAESRVHVQYIVSGYHVVLVVSKCGCVAGVENGDLVSLKIYRDTGAFVRPRVPCVSRLPPVSFYRYAPEHKHTVGNIMHNEVEGDLQIGDQQAPLPTPSCTSRLRSWV